MRDGRVSPRSTLMAVGVRGRPALGTDRLLPGEGLPALDGDLGVYTNSTFHVIDEDGRLLALPRVHTPRKDRAMTTKMATPLRKCIGSERFNIPSHEAPPSDFPVQPSGRDGLGRMCKPHWTEYTRELRLASNAAAPPSARNVTP
jgi:hypothetical protein